MLRSIAAVLPALLLAALPAAAAPVGFAPPTPSGGFASPVPSGGFASPVPGPVPAGPGRIGPVPPGSYRPHLVLPPHPVRSPHAYRRYRYGGRNYLPRYRPHPRPY